MYLRTGFSRDKGRLNLTIGLPVANRPKMRPIARDNISTMQLYGWQTIEKERLNPTFERQVIHGETLTVARVYMHKGCKVPVHQHVNEQISLIEEGALKFNLEGKELVVRAGQVLQIPPNVPHSAEALEETVGIDFFAPVRQDWLDGTDAYLRK
jgi:quercetin dioxygenase-like cupin family protein